MAKVDSASFTSDGLAEAQARSRISLFDINGLIEPSRKDLLDFQRPYAHPHAPGQDNNLYIFPAVGLAIYATQAKHVTDEMFIAAARGVAEQVTQAELDSGVLYPPQTDILQTIVTAQRVAEVIFARNLAVVQKPADMKAFIQSKLYKPEYPHFK